MSSIQRFYDLGATMGLLGATHAPDHNPFLPNRRPSLKETVKIVHKFTGSSMVVIAAEHEPVRVLGFSQQERHALMLTLKPPHYYAYCLREPSCGVFVEAHFMDANDVRTICMPVCDHPVIGVQLVDDQNRVLGFGALRATPDRLCGMGSVISALFEHLGQYADVMKKMRHIHFHLSAGRGPCCIMNMSERRRVVHDKLHDVGYYAFRDDDIETDKGFDMLNVLAIEIKRHEERVSASFTVNSRDRDCTVCCAKHAGMPYYSAEDERYNMAVFGSDMKLPVRKRW